MILYSNGRESLIVFSYLIINKLHDAMMRQIESRVSKQRRRHLRRREDGDNFLSQRQGIQRELTEHGEHLLTYCTGYFSSFGQSLGTAEF